MKRKILVGLLGCLCSLGFVWAQQQESRPYWFTLEQGKRYFRDGSYGNALMAFEDARAQRRTLYTQMEEDMITLLSLPEVRRLGDSLDRIETYIAERNHINAGRALEELYYRVSRESLGGSARQVLVYLDRLKDYPEAEYWIGETYRVEGELGIAFRQYQKAYDQRALLETPGFEIEIIYKIIDVHRVRQEYVEMERRLLEIVQRDSLWTEDSDTFIRSAMTRTVENDSINRFLTLYRYRNASVERAHRLLGFYYYASGRHSRAAEHLLFAFLIQNTLLIDEMTYSQYNYTFTTLEGLINEVSRRPNLVTYLETVEYFKTLYYLGGAFFGNGNKIKPARDFWTLLQGRPEAGEWKGRAETQLKSPFVERAVEMP